MRVLFLLPLFFLIAHPCIAIREGTATADIFIKRYEQSGDFGKLALWHEAAAECLKRISVPMNEIAHDYYSQRGYKKWAARAKKETREIQEQYKYHRKCAKIAWQKSETPKPTLDAERENITKFIATWLPRYPDRFYEFGIYPTFFRKQRESAEQKGNYVRALHLEADAAEMCAAQYARIPIAYGFRNYQKLRDAYQQHALLLRSLAKQNLNALPIVTRNVSLYQSEIDKGKRILRSFETQKITSQATADAILHIAKSDARVKTALANQNGVRAYPSFQGFAWIVSFANHSQGNIALAIIEKKTMKVLEVCIPNSGR